MLRSLLVTLFIGLTVSAIAKLITLTASGNITDQDYELSNIDPGFCCTVDLPAFSFDYTITFDTDNASAFFNDFF